MKFDAGSFLRSAIQGYAGYVAGQVQAEEDLRRRAQEQHEHEQAYDSFILKQLGSFDKPTQPKIVQWLAGRAANRARGFPSDYISPNAAPQMQAGGLMFQPHPQPAPPTPPTTQPPTTPPTPQPRPQPRPQPLTALAPLATGAEPLTLEAPTIAPAPYRPGVADRRRRRSIQRSPPRSAPSPSPRRDLAHGQPLLLHLRQ
jgi:hypothetical protein